MKPFRSTLLSLMIALMGAILISGCDDNRPDVSTDLFNAFGATCSSSGLWTRQALQQNQALIDTLNSLKEKNPCKDYLSSLLVIQNATSQAQKLLHDDSYLQYRQDQEKLQELSLALKTPPSDAKLTSQLKEQLIETQVDLMDKRAMARASQEANQQDQYAQATGELSQYLQTLTAAEQSGSGIAACLKAYPEAAVGIAGNLLSIGGSFVSPVYGAAFSVIGQLMSIGVDYASHAATEDAIWNLNSAQMPLALRCGLESMTEMYCDANDSFSLLELKRNSIDPLDWNPNDPKSQVPAPIWRGMDLLTKRMPVLNDWLSRVKGGVAPTDPVLANKQNEILDKMNTVEKVKNIVYASLSDDQQKYNNASPDQKENLMVRAILDQINNIFSGGQNSTTMPTNGSTNPFTEVTSDKKNYACWLVLGYNAQCPPPTQTEYDAESYVRDQLVKTATFEGLFTNWDGIYASVKAQVDQEFSQTITANPSSLIADFWESRPGSVSPRDVLEMLVSYFTDLQITLPQDGNPAINGHLQESIDLVKSIIDKLDVNDPARGVDKIGFVFQKLELNRGLQIFADRVSRIVEWDLNARIKNGEFPTDLGEILKLAGNEIRNRLVNAGQADSDSDLQKDLNSARSIAQQNIEVFRNFFANDLGRSVSLLHQAAIDAGEPERGPDRPNGQGLGHLCTLILATGNAWPSQVDIDICRHAYLDPLYEGANSPAFSIEVAKLEQDLQGKPFQTRFCAYHRYLRAERLAEMLLPQRREMEREGFTRPSAGPIWNSDNLMEFLVH